MQHFYRAQQCSGSCHSTFWWKKARRERTIAPPACRSDSFSFCSLMFDAAGTTELRFDAHCRLPRASARSSARGASAANSGKDRRRTGSHHSLGPINCLWFLAYPWLGLLLRLVSRLTLADHSSAIGLGHIWFTFG